MSRPQKIWTHEEIRFLRDHYLTMTYEELAREFGCSGPTVCAKCKQLGLQRKPLLSENTIHWTDEQERYLIEHFPTEPACDIAEHLGISYPTVLKKAKAMGLKKSPDYDRFKVCTNRYVKNYRHASEGRKRDLIMEAV